MTEETQFRYSLKKSRGNGDGSMIEKRPFGLWEAYRLSRGRLSVTVITRGAAIQALDFAGRPLVLGYESPEEYGQGRDYLGAVVGRFANRIAGARFCLDGREYRLPANEGPNHHHGGPEGFDRRSWQAEVPDEYSLRLSLVSPAGDQGYPGALTAAVTYRLEEDALRLVFEGKSTADTVYGPTSHMYFRMDPDARQTMLRIGAQRYLTVDGALLPRAEASAEGDFDFRRLRPIGRDFDHCFLLDSPHAATAEGGGVRVELYTDFPALHLYTGHGLGPPFGPYGGFALEPEFPPDSPNRDPELCRLRAGERFRRYMLLRFSETE